jgi:hypothetical protein
LEVYRLTATTGATEEYNGSTWPQVRLNTARNNLGGAGTQTAALAFGGTPPLPSATEEYNGSTWTTSPATLITARYNLGGAGTQTAALAFGGITTCIQEQQKNMMVQLGQLEEL